MAVTESGTGGEVLCPLCEEYEGAPSSVEAHISRMTDGHHKGEVGRSHRDYFEESEPEDSGEESQVPLQETVEDSGEESSEDGLQEGGVDISPEMALVAATVLFLLWVVATKVLGGDGSDSGGSASTDEQDDQDGTGQQQPQGGLVESEVSLVEG